MRAARARRRRSVLVRDPRTSACRAPCTCDDMPLLEAYIATTSRTRATHGSRSVATSRKPGGPDVRTRGDQAVPEPVQGRSARRRSVHDVQQVRPGEEQAEQGCRRSPYRHGGARPVLLRAFCQGHHRRHDRAREDARAHDHPRRARQRRLDSPVARSGIGGRPACATRSSRLSSRNSELVSYDAGIKALEAAALAHPEPSRTSMHVGAAAPVRPADGAGGPVAVRLHGAPAADLHAHPARCDAVRVVDAACSMLAAARMMRAGAAALARVRRLAVFGCTLVAYATALHGPFQFDDFGVIVRYEPVHSFGGWWAVARPRPAPVAQADVRGELAARPRRARLSPDEPRRAPRQRRAGHARVHGGRDARAPLAVHDVRSRCRRRGPVVRGAPDSDRSGDVHQRPFVVALDARSCCSRCCSTPRAARSQATWRGWGLRRLRTSCAALTKESCAALPAGLLLWELCIEHGRGARRVRAPRSASGSLLACCSPRRS